MPAAPIPERRPTRVDYSYQLSAISYQLSAISYQLSAFSLQPSVCLQVAPQKCHGSEDRLPQAAGIDADCPIEAELDRLAAGRASHDVCKPRQVRKADGQIERDD